MPWLPRIAALSALGDLSGKDAAFHALAHDSSPAVRLAAMGELGGIDRDAKVQALYERVTTDEDPDVCAAALRIFQRMHDVTVGEQPKLWPDRPEAISWLREYVAADPFAADRRVAVDLLADFVEHSDVRVVLHRIAEHHPDESDRVRVMTRFFLSDRDDPDTRDVLLRVAATDPSPRVRAEAREHLAD
jgi:hypothetical protein